MAGTSATAERTNGSTPDGGTEITVPQIRLKPIQVHRVDVPIRGITPVIPHKWSEKALRAMREKQSGSTVQQRHEAKVPLDEAEGCAYYLPDGVTPGIPATAFKAAIVGAIRLFDGLTMKAGQQMVFTEGVGPDQLIAIEDYTREIREDLPRNANGSPDLRYRYAYYPWKLTLPVRYMPSQIDLTSVLSLVGAAGLGGVGDWRPSAPKSHTGTFGMFEIDPDKEAQTS